jgi:A/G-specific adenine glycosylase
MRGGGSDFAARVVEWQRRSGRHDLPWQVLPDPYRVWLSEIMLQQTQVSTVRDYYGRFLERFPDLASLAQAELDDVLGLWSGLGYYSRARNLHRCAQAVRDRFGGELPKTAALLQTLPGIGRSTAAAIASFCFSERVAILDGNVRRVLSRVFGFAADLSATAGQQALWALAEGLLPREQHAADMPRYTQGLMDIGATVCVSRNPRCDVCPLEDLCVARLERNPLAYPVRTRKLVRTSESIWLLWAQDPEGSIWLERRPATGVWAGLFCMPVFASSQELGAAVPADQKDSLRELPVVIHALTHKDLHLHPVRIGLVGDVLATGDGGEWFTSVRWPKLGLPAPIRKLLLIQPASV